MSKPTDRTGAVLITGATSGIGLELARLFAAANRDLVLVARSSENLARVKVEVQTKAAIRVWTFSIDLSEEAAASQLYQAVKGEGIEIDILVNNAGIGTYGLFAESDPATELKMLRLNTAAPTLLTRLFLDDMIRRKQGKILNVASTAAFQPGPYMAVYYATKAYLVMFGEALRNELQGTNITVTTLCPGPTRTSFQSAAGMTRSRLSTSASRSAEEVARVGYQGMMNNKGVVIVGRWPRIMAACARMIPTHIAAAIVRKAQEPG